MYTPYWAQVKESQLWVFSLKEHAELEWKRIVCGHDHLTVHATGTLKLQPGCKAIANNYQLFTNAAMSLTPIELP
ncbi:hypothetical protein TSAR_006718 [Trichomalopsis sarcophagae]|uniref:Uncharacterized protein n=1 Tax=Trichomalopsis sarcophagae TaxID=543379 RepID=A0A232ENA1_9HYME|nr:hypothetical protein TSAR_006718 [Trichomalopsis sarcophagae]